jgi:hypothetical protein
LINDRSNFTTPNDNRVRKVETRYQRTQTIEMTNVEQNKTTLGTERNTRNEVIPTGTDTTTVIKQTQIVINNIPGRD